MTYAWMSILPPLIVLVFGFFTHRVLLSLFCGVATAALIAQDFNPLNTSLMIIKRLWGNSDLWRLQSMQSLWGSWNLFICIFLLILGIIVTIISYSGAAYAFRVYATRHIKNARDAESASLLLSTFFFIDDYFSSLTVGSVMHPLTDQFKVPRVKLAFLVDAMAAPLAILCPVSSWVAGIIGFLTENGISLQVTPNTLIKANAFTVYLYILPFLFYSFIIMSAAWFIVRYRISFGSMKEQEITAQTTGNLFGGKQETQLVIHSTEDEYGAIIDFILPVCILFCAVVFGMLFSGGFYLFGGSYGILGALQHANAAKSLFVGGLISLLLCTTYFLMRKKITIGSLPIVYWRGIQLMGPTILILLLAWTLGDILREDLKTGQFLASLIVGSLPLYVLPAMFFIVSFITSFSIGSSWGTIAILLPIALPMILSIVKVPIPASIEQLNILFPVLGAIFSGAVAGDHISPISDTTLMSSTSTGSYHIDHVSTQMTYALPVIGATSISFLLAGYFAPYSLLIAFCVSACFGIGSTVFILAMLNKK